MFTCKGVYSCKRVAVQKCQLVQRPCVQKSRRAKVSIRAKVTLVQKIRRVKVSPSAKVSSCKSVARAIVTRSHLK